jgi:phosphoribosylaminoimidazole-succinocarboxamide synthase
VRSWVAARCDPYVDPIPEIPAELIESTSKVYVEAFEKITGQTFQPPAATDGPVLERIRRNLAPYRP